MLHLLQVEAQELRRHHVHGHGVVPAYEDVHRHHAGRFLTEGRIVAEVGGLDPVYEGEVRPDIGIDVCELLVQLEVVIRDAALLVDKPELVLNTQGNRGHGMALELGHGNIEILPPLPDKVLVYEVRDVDEGFQLLKIQGHLGSLIEVYGYGACLLAHPFHARDLVDKPGEVPLGAVFHHVDVPGSMGLKVPYCGRHHLGRRIDVRLEVDTVDLNIDIFGGFQQARRIPRRHRIIGRLPHPDLGLCPQTSHVPWLSSSLIISLVVP